MINHFSFNKQFSLLLILLSITINKLNGQNVNSSEPQLAGEYYTEQKDFAGSQFFNENWIIADVELKNGEVVISQPLKYNGFTDDFIWLEPTVNRQVKLDKHLISKVNFYTSSQDSTTSFVFWDDNYPYKSSLSNSFVQVLYSGKISIYAKRNVVQSARMENVFINGKPYKRILLASNHNYYIHVDNKNILSVRLNRRSFCSVISDNTKECLKEFRRNRIRIRNEKDLINAAIWYEKSVLTSPIN